jgi:3-oxoacyl-[acyl-carrier protein] reductase
MSRTALVTGGSRGIGFATARLLAANGWQVGLCSRNGAQAHDAAERIAAVTGNAHVAGWQADIGDGGSIEALFSHIDARFQRLDALVNNAAVFNACDVFGETKEFEEMMRVNVTGAMLCSRQAFACMRKDGGSIVNIGSLAGIPGTDKIAPFWGYTTSKFAVAGLTEGLAAEGRTYGIRVNCVAPGATDTEMLRRAAPGFKARAQPVDIARVIYYLCDSDQSGILTGTTVPVFCNA